MKKLFFAFSLLVTSSIAFPQLGYKYHDNFINLSVKDSSICFIQTKSNINDLEDSIANKCHKIMDSNHYIVHRSVVNTIKDVDYFSEIYTTTGDDQIIILPRIVFCVKSPTSFNSDVLQMYDKIEIESNNSKRYVLKCFVNTSKELLEMVSAISNEEWTLWCEPEMLLNIELSNPLYSQQYYLKNTGQNGGLYGIDINVEPAWNISSGNGVVVAVIDEGVDNNHEDLQGKVLSGYTACVPTGNGEPMNAGGIYKRAHGIACAGIIAANNNNIGIKGIAYDSQILPINIYSQTPNPPYYNGAVSTTDVADAINWAYPQSDIISNSWNGGGSSSDLELAIQNARTYGRNGLGSIVIFSSGNSTSNPNSVKYPANVEGVVTVGAVDNQGTIWNYSCRGDSMDLVAPSGNINLSGDVVTTDRMDILGYNNTNYVYVFGGTSAACPQIAGVAALIISANPNLTELQVVDILRTTARDMGTVGFDNTYGYGLVDAHAAVMEAYFYDREILGNDIINPCNTTYPYNMAFTYNLNNSSKPNNTTVQWSVTGNLELISSNNYQANIRPTGNGTGIIRISYTHEGYTVTKEKQITIESLPPSSNYYCNYSTTGNMTFSNELYINGTFTINNGHVVTISCIGQCLPDAKIVVQPGGKLIVNDGKLTSYCSNKMWDGIYVVGDTTKRQLAQYQGTLEVKNGSLIENAKNAIVTWDGNNYATSGGIVKCSNSIFLNNRQSIRIYDYTNHTSGGAETDNVSYAQNCTFVLNDNNLFSSNNVSFCEFVKISHVRGVSFKGSSFRDGRATADSQTKGIWSIDAGFTASEHCTMPYSNLAPCTCTGTETRTKFSRLGYGIYATNGGTTYNFTAGRAIFDTCYRAVQVVAVNNSKITRSSFDQTSQGVFTGSYATGVYLDNSSGYTVEGNSFTTNYTTCPSGFQGRGVFVQSSGSDVNTIYRNTMSNLYNGIKCNSSNSGLQVQCNEFSGSFNADIQVMNTISSSQGSSSKSAGNKFTSGAINFLNMNANNIVTYYNSGNYDANNVYCPYNSFYTTIVSNITANNCASTICIPIPVNPPGPKSAYENDDITLYESLQQIYETRLAEYTAAGYDFLLENFDVNDADIVATARLMQDTLISLSRAMSEIANRNLNAILADSVLDRESLNGWYDRINTTTAKYSLANSYFETGEYSLARQELAAIPQRFTLSSVELAEYNNFCDYNALRESVYTSGRNYAQLTDDEIAELEAIAGLNTGVSSAYANSVLCFFYGICQEIEEPDFDDTPMNNKNAIANVEENENESLAVYVYPNPADDELNILINSLPEGSTTIEFHDVAGRLMLSQEITSTNAIIDISSLKQGIYMYRIVNGDRVIARNRIVKE